MLSKNSRTEDHLHSDIDIAQVLDCGADIVLVSVGDDYKPAYRVVADDLYASEHDVQINVELAGDGGHKRFAGASLEVLEPEYLLTRLELHQRGFLLDEGVYSAQAGCRVHEGARHGLLRVREYLEHVALLDYPAVFHYGGAVAYLLDYVHLVSDQHDGKPQLCVEGLQQLQYRLGGLRVESRRCLVAQEYLRVACERPCDSRALLLTAGKLRGVRINGLSNRT